ncbi:hypothetical protein VP01_12328g1, partial [Puccinia sorghi]
SAIHTSWKIKFSEYQLNLPSLIFNIKGDSKKQHKYQSKNSKLKIFDLKQFMKMTEQYNMTCKNGTKRCTKKDFEHTIDVLELRIMKLQRVIRKRNGRETHFNPEVEVFFMLLLTFFSHNSTIIST